MSITERVITQATLLAGKLDAQEAALLEVLCSCMVASLTARLKADIAPEDCEADLVAAASLYALAAMEETSAAEVEEFKAGDLTVKKGSHGNMASQSLRQQAQLRIRPYLQDCFSFAEV